MYSFVPSFREAKLCGVPLCVFDKLGCAASEQSLGNTALHSPSRSDACLETPYWPGTFSPSFLVSDWPTPSASPSSNNTKIPPLPSIATSALKMETVRFSETLVATDESTRRQNPEEHHQVQLKVCRAWKPDEAEY
jgi:hypothetical protein